MQRVLRKNEQSQSVKSESEHDNILPWKAFSNEGFPALVYVFVIQILNIFTLNELPFILGLSIAS